MHAWRGGEGAVKDLGSSVVGGAAGWGVSTDLGGPGHEVAEEAVELVDPLAELGLVGGRVPAPQHHHCGCQLSKT
jgi:hypothetical protein